MARWPTQRPRGSWGISLVPSFAGNLHRLITYANIDLRRRTHSSFSRDQITVFLVCILCEYDNQHVCCDKYIAIKEASILLFQFIRTIIIQYRHHYPKIKNVQSSGHSQSHQTHDQQHEESIKFPHGPSDGRSSMHNYGLLSHLIEIEQNGRYAVINNDRSG